MKIKEFGIIPEYVSRHTPQVIEYAELHDIPIHSAYEEINISHHFNKHNVLLKSALIQK